MGQKQSKWYKEFSKHKKGSCNSSCVFNWGYLSRVTPRFCIKQEANTFARGSLHDLLKFWIKGHCTTKLPDLLLKKYWTETKPSWEQVKVHAGHLSQAKAQVNHGWLILVNVERFLSHGSTSAKKREKGAPFCFSRSFWIFSALSFCRVQLFQSNIEGVSEKDNKNVFKKIPEGAFLGFCRFLVSKNLAWRG